MNFRVTNYNKVILELSSDINNIVGTWNGLEQKLLIKVDNKEIYNDRIKYNFTVSNFQQLIQENIRYIVNKRENNDII